MSLLLYGFNASVFASADHYGGEFIDSDFIEHRARYILTVTVFNDLTTK